MACLVWSRVLAGWALVLLLIGHPALAQITTSSITGLVSDPSGAALADAKTESNRFGNSGRNILNGPGAQFWVMSLARTFPMERFRLDFRAEVYSVFNHQNWNSPNTSVVDPNFGRIFGKNGPRRFQFGARVEF